MGPHNRARGEVSVLIDGAPCRLCVTLGALAELEAAFDVVSLSELGDRLARLTAADVILVLSALLTGGGNPMAPGEIARAHIDPKAAAAVIADAFKLAFDDEA